MTTRLNALVNVAQTQRADIQALSVMEVPQEQAAKLSESTDYTPGQVINAKA